LKFTEKERFGSVRGEIRQAILMRMINMKLPDERVTGSTKYLMVMNESMKLVMMDEDEEWEGGE